MNRYEDNADEFKKLTEKAKSTGDAIITTSQKKSELHPWQIDILESMKFLEKADCIFSITKKRANKGEVTIKLINNNLSGLRSLFKNK